MAKRLWHLSQNIPMKKGLIIKKSFSAILLIKFLCLTLTSVWASGFINQKLTIEKDSIKVSFFFASEESFVKELKEGASKEVLVYADLFRQWNILPDEFVTGTKIIVNLYSDPLKEEYIASKYDGNRSLVKRFRSVDSMLEWAFRFRDLEVAKMKGYEDGNYYIKIKAEAYSDTVVSLLAKMLLLQPKDFSYEMIILRFKYQKGRIIPEQ